MCILISDWFTAMHMTYYNFTLRPRKCNITALQGHNTNSISRPPAWLPEQTEAKSRFCHDNNCFIISIEQII